MKLPRLLTVRQAVVLAIAAVVIAIFLKLFAPVTEWLLLATAFLAAVYAALMAYVPELVEPEK